MHKVWMHRGLITIASLELVDHVAEAVCNMFPCREVNVPSDCPMLCHMSQFHSESPLPSFVAFLSGYKCHQVQIFRDQNFSLSHEIPVWCLPTA